MGNHGEVNTAPPSPPPAMTTVHDLPDGPLELILLRLSSSIHLVRAACACKRWRRVVADAGFLRRFRSLHGHARPVVAGHYRVDERKHGSRPPGCNPVFCLSRSSADDGLRPESFSLDFLPDSDDGTGCWDLADSRDGVLLLTGCPPCDGRDSFYSLVVCDPIARSCSRVIGYPVPVFLANWSCFGAFLLDGGDGGEISTSNFRILVASYEEGEAMTSVFTSSAAAAADDWMQWWVGGLPCSVPWGGEFFYFLAGHTDDAVYWTAAMGGHTGRSESEVVVLDKRTLEFSRSLFPEWLPYGRDPQLRAVRCGDGTVRIVLLDMVDLRTFVLGAGEGGDDVWAEERRISIRQLGVQGAAKLQLLAVVKGSVVLGTADGAGLVSVELSTMKFRRVGDEDRYSGAHGPSFEYQLPWPPTIRACLP